MLTLIQPYLSSLYHITTSEVGNDGIYLLEDERKHKSPIYPEKLLKEIIDVFALGEEEAKNSINDWATIQKEDVDLTFFWSTKEDILEGVFPLIARIQANTIGLDLVPVQPISTPTGLLTYLDFTYTGSTEDYLSIIP